MQITSQNVFERWPLEDKSVQTIITSPPYFQLRKYNIPDIVIGGDKDCVHEFEKQVHKNPNATGGSGHKQDSVKGSNHGSIMISYFCHKCGAFKGQYGLEPYPFGHPHGFVEHTLLWLREAWRVLKDDGTIAIVIDDSYAGSNKGRGAKYQGIGKNQEYYDYTELQKQLPPDTTFGVRKKSLLLIPERIMIGMQEMGFIIRNKIWWTRTMPESVKDRFSATSETIIFAAKNPEYYFNLDIVKEPIKDITIKRYMNNFVYSGEKHYTNNAFPYKNQEKRAEKIKSTLFKMSEETNHHNMPLLKGVASKKTKIKAEDAETIGSPRARYHRGKVNRPPEETGILSGGHFNYGGLHSDNSIYREKQASVDESVLLKNPGVIWLDYWIEGHREMINTLGVEGYLEALRNQILSESDLFPPLIQNNSTLHYAPFSNRLVKRLILALSRAGDVVLDPFVGSGTTVIVAQELGRHGIGFDIGYHDISTERIKETNIGLSIL